MTDLTTLASRHFPELLVLALALFICAVIVGRRVSGDSLTLPQRLLRWGGFGIGVLGAALCIAAFFADVFPTVMLHPYYYGVISIMCLVASMAIVTHRFAPAVAATPAAPTAPAAPPRQQRPPAPPRQFRDPYVRRTGSSNAPGEIFVAKPDENDERFLQ